jgi:hypothetical protein
MRFYETSLNDYVEKVEQFNLHAEHPTMEKMRQYCYLKPVREMPNIIFYGPSGVGKYSQMLYFLSKMVDGHFKFQQKLQVQKDAKDNYKYTMSDIYFEVDMGLLGCNSKTLWHEIYQQVMDIVSIKPKRVGIIVCKNFHLIHSELLDIFYSYIQQNNFNLVADSESNNIIKYVLLTEQISFIPSNIVNSFVVVKFKRPTIEQLNRLPQVQPGGTIAKLPYNNIKSLFQVQNQTAIQPNILKMVCENIIEQIETPQKIIITQFRDLLYEILTYGLDIGECIWYVIIHFERKNGKGDIETMMKIYNFLKKFNNNYRPISHLENLFLGFSLSAAHPL